MSSNQNDRVPKPHWLRRRLPCGPEYEKVNRMLKEENLNTVCKEADCPNTFECFSDNTATFLILGKTCTRTCRFCAIDKGTPGPVDREEPRRIASSVKRMELGYVVITSVTRDDLEDGGASIFSETIRRIREDNPKIRIEVLIPDFLGDESALHAIAKANPDVINHNIETVPRLYPEIRPEADYRRSLSVLEKIKDIDPNIFTKSGIMVGLGEKTDEIHQVLEDLAAVKCEFLTMGQYLQPSIHHPPVARYVEPEEFIEWEKVARSLGFSDAAAGPLVRSSYQAKNLYDNHQKKIVG